MPIVLQTNSTKYFLLFFSPKTMLNSRWALSCSRHIKIALGEMVEANYRGHLKASVMFFLER